MALIYNVTIEPGDKEGVFQIAWQKKGTHQRDVFEHQAGDISQEEAERLWQQPRYQQDVGRKLFRFLDGDNRYLQRALDEAHLKGETLRLDLCACDRTADWPFELLAGDGGFLLPERMHLVRCVSGYGAAKKIIPQDRPLKLLFIKKNGGQVFCAYTYTISVNVDEEIGRSGIWGRLRVPGKGRSGHRGNCINYLTPYSIHTVWQNVANVGLNVGANNYSPLPPPTAIIITADTWHVLRAWHHFPIFRCLIGESKNEQKKPKYPDGLENALNSVSSTIGLPPKTSCFCYAGTFTFSYRNSGAISAPFGQQSVWNSGWIVNCLKVLRSLSGSNISP